jgi:hypothetical protein
MEQGLLKDEVGGGTPQGAVTRALWHVDSTSSGCSDQSDARVFKSYPSIHRSTNPAGLFQNVTPTLTGTYVLVSPSVTIHTYRPSMKRSMPKPMSAPRPTLNEVLPL